MHTLARQTFRAALCAVFGSAVVLGIGFSLQPAWSAEESTSLPPGVILRINGNDITRQQFLDDLNEAWGESYRETYITHFLLEERAKRLGIEAGKSEIERALNTSIDQALAERFDNDKSRLEASLRGQGLTFETWKRKLRKDTRYEILAEKLAAKDRDVTDEDVRRAFEDKYGQGGELLKVRHIQKNLNLTHTPDYTLQRYEQDKLEIDRDAKARAEEALGKIRAGETFDTVLNAYSDDPRKIAGGTLNVWKGKFGAEFDAAVLALKEREISGVLATTDGYRIIQCVSVAKNEEVHAQHILFVTGAKAKGRSIEAAKKLAEDTLADIRKGADFTELAKERSEDPTTQHRGGDLGWFGGRSMTRPFDDAAFALQPGQVSDVVKTGYGFHIIKMLERRETEDRTIRQILISTEYQKVKERRVRPILETKARERLQAALDEMKSTGASFANIAQKYSEDTATKEQGGLLHPYLEGVYKGEFDEAVKSMKAGDPPRLVRDGSGNLHLVIVEGLVKTDFASVKDALKKELLERPLSRIEKAEYVKRLRESAKIAPDQSGT